MNTINTRLHGILDYSLSIILLFSPWLFNYSRGIIESCIPVFAGLLSIAYTLFTNAEFGVIKKIRLSNHFLLDLILGSFLIVSPKLFQYEGYVFVLPYLWIGLIKIFISLSAGNVLHSKHVEQKTTRTQPIGELKNVFLHAKQLVSHLNKQNNQQKSVV